VRPIDLTYPTNRAIILIALVVALAGLGFRSVAGESLFESASWGLGAGFAIILAWASARELDPDHDLSAFVGAGLLLAGFPLLDLAELLTLVWLLLALRLVNRTPGLPARILDSLGVLGLGGWLIWQGNWIAGLITAVAFLLDGLLTPPLRRHLFFGGMAVIILVVLSVFHGNLVMEQGPSLPTVLGVVAASVPFLGVVATSRQLAAVGDASGERLTPGRVQAAQILALLTALMTAWWQGIAGVVALLPLWAAILGVGLYWLGRQLIQRCRTYKGGND
jgi:hypothetical protein